MRIVFLKIIYKKASQQQSSMPIHDSNFDTVIPISVQPTALDCELYDAVMTFFQFKRISVAVLQTRFRVGYQHACDIVKSLEDIGIISGLSSGNSTRKLLLTEADFTSKYFRDKPKDANDEPYDPAELLAMQSRAEQRLSELRAQIQEEQSKVDEATRRLDNAAKRLLAIRTTYKSAIEAATAFAAGGYPRFTMSMADFDNLLTPTVILYSHSMELRDLRKRFKDNEKQIDALQLQYEARYTTKANQTIYRLLVLALRAELQNILTNLKYDKLDKNLAALHEMIEKFNIIVCDGNQAIAPTVQRFLAQIEVLFAEAINIEYDYYIQQERIKAEQAEIRARMREEAAERKELEEEQKKLEAEEAKYRAEIAAVQEQMKGATAEQLDLLHARVVELNDMVSGLDEKREQIVKLQNGRAGYVYVISNLGAFGDDVFKIGMTRRQNPQERIDELSSASVPFPFDVHCTLFAENASDLERSLHLYLNDKRVNKVNTHKEFFRISLDALEQVVHDYLPHVVFSRTMLAEQYRQTLAVESGLVDGDLTSAVNADDDDNDFDDAEEA